MLTTIAYKDEELTILDQTLLPENVVYKTLDSVQSVYEAIERLEVRGAPLIGVTAAYGVLVGIREHKQSPHILEEVKQVCSYLSKARPTAVNLNWALERMLNVALSYDSYASGPTLFSVLEEEAQRIHKEDIEICRRIGEQTYELVKDLVKDNSITIMTHCNAGALATAGIGTATSVMYLMQEKGINVRVFTCETRPLLQGARLTALELSSAGIDTTLITDNMAATVMSQGIVDFVIVGADRVAANLDTANKIGTLGLSLIAKSFEVPFYVACPSPTLDNATPTGNEIEIEERDGREITTLGGVVIAPAQIKTFNPSFDVTPAAHITAIITENEILSPQ